MSWHQQIATVLNTAPKHISPLSGGMIGEVYRVELQDGRIVVAKVASEHSDASLNIEGFMLQYLHDHTQLPVPQVIYSSKNLLLMSFIEGKSHLGKAEQRHAAELLAELHAIQSPQFGFEQATLIGPLPQPNPWVDSWINFFREHRLIYMAEVAYTSNRLPAGVYKRIQKFSEHLEQWLLEPSHPSLLHGDLWTTNILTQEGRVTGLLDPAIYYGHAEIELAYTTLFGTMGTTFQSVFFEQYHELSPIEAGFFEERRDIYNLYPLLVHVRLFGGGYVNSVDGVLRQFGF